MSFALPFARSASNELSETRLAGLGLAAISLFLFTLAAFSPQVLRDGDTWSHVATGEWIIAHGSGPRADPFSHSMASAPWTAHEWLSEVLLALAFGGFLIFEHVRPSIDARVELYGDGMLSLYDKLRSGDREAFEEALKRYDIAWTIFAPDNRIVAALDREPGWRRLYADATAVVHVRDTALGPMGLGKE